MMAKTKENSRRKPTAIEVHDALKQAHQHASMDTDQSIDRTREVLEKFFPGQLHKEGKEHYP